MGFNADSAVAGVVMPHTNTIFVTSLHDMPHFVRELSPARLVSAIQPELQPARPRGIAEADHHRVEVHDIQATMPDAVLIERNHVETLVAFLDEWNPTEGSLLVHCYAGVSRSTATALIAATMKLGDPLTAALLLRVAAPHALPNGRFLALADEVLGLDGTLIEARARMGDAELVPDTGPLTVLRIGPP